MLRTVVDRRALQTDEAVHTVLDDFEHFCAYSGSDLRNAWAKFAYVSARLPKS